MRAARVMAQGQTESDYKGLEARDHRHVASEKERLRSENGTPASMCCQFAAGGSGSGLLGRNDVDSEVDGGMVEGEGFVDEFQCLLDDRGVLADDRDTAQRAVVAA